MRFTFSLDDGALNIKIFLVIQATTFLSGRSRDLMVGPSLHILGRRWSRMGCGSLLEFKFRISGSRKSLKISPSLQVIVDE